MVKKVSKEKEQEIEQKPEFDIELYNVKVNQLNMLEDQSKDISKNKKEIKKDIKNILNVFLEDEEVINDLGLENLYKISDDTALFVTFTNKKQTSPNAKIIDVLLRVLQEQGFFGMKDIFIERLAALFGVDEDSINIDGTKISVKRHDVQTTSPLLLLNKEEKSVEVYINEKMLTTIDFLVYNIDDVDKGIKEIWFFKSTEELAFKIFKSVDGSDLINMILNTIVRDLLTEIKKTGSRGKFTYKGVKYKYDKNSIVNGDITLGYKVIEQ